MTKAIRLCAAFAIGALAGCSPPAPDNATIAPTPTPTPTATATPLPPKPTPSPVQPVLVPGDSDRTGIGIPKVAAVAPEVAERINAVLDREREEARNALEACRRTAGDQPIDYKLEARTMLNARGLLSLRIIGAATCGGSGGATPLYGAHSFDVRTGEEIAVMAATGLNADQLGDIARRYYAGPAACAALLAEAGAAPVGAAYLDPKGIGVIFAFSPGAAASCADYPAVIPTVVARMKLDPPLDRLVGPSH